MKNILLIITTLFLFGITTTATAQESAIDKVTVKVDGLGCPFCAYGLEKKFKELKGIQNVAIEMETGMMNFDYPSAKAISMETVEKQVEKAGYTPIYVTIERGDGTMVSTKKEKIEVAMGDRKELSFFVAGNCGMCKARIEKAALDTEGVVAATWNKENKMLNVEVVNHLSQEDIEKNIAEAGHDTKTAKSSTATYEQLPGCCHYDRL